MPVLMLCRETARHVPAECGPKTDGGKTENRRPDMEQVEEWLHKGALKNAFNLTCFFFRMHLSNWTQNIICRELPEIKEKKKMTISPSANTDGTSFEEGL